MATRRTRASFEQRSAMPILGDTRFRPGSAPPIIVQVATGSSITVTKSMAGRRGRFHGLSSGLRGRQALALVPGSSPGQGFCFGSLLDVAARSSGAFKAVRWSGLALEADACGASISQ